MTEVVSHEGFQTDHRSVLDQELNQDCLYLISVPKSLCKVDQSIIVICITTCNSAAHKRSLFNA